MTTYTRPGVYIEETLNPLTNVSVDPSGSVAAFVGPSTGGGPVGPTLVQSWSQYQALFGGVGRTDDDLSYALYGFFSNGGAASYVVRALNSNATAATLSINGTQTTPASVLNITAISPGIWASDSASNSRIYVTVTPSSVTGSNRFDLTVEVGTGSYLAARENFVDLTMKRDDGRYAVDVINSPSVGSRFINVVNAIPASTAFTGTLNPALTNKAPLTGGSDGTGTPDVVAATARLDRIDRNLVVNVPGASGTDLISIVNWAVASGRHFIVADVPKPASNETSSASVSAQTTFTDTLPNTSHVAVYGPWLYIQDPGSRAGALRLTAPGGSVVGQYIRTDNSRGVFKAPAGIDTQLVGVLQPYVEFSNSEQDTLTNSGVNIIKSQPGAGVCIWGARTQGTGFPDRYIPVRRLLISLKSALASVTRFAVFENINGDLRETVSDVVGNYLQAQFDQGAFKGSSPDQAYYVICDETNNSQSDEDGGVVNIEVGVALQNPAEFLVIRLGQAVSGTTATDNLEEA